MRHRLGFFPGHPANHLGNPLGCIAGVSAQQVLRFTGKAAAQPGDYPIVHGLAAEVAQGLKDHGAGAAAEGQLLGGHVLERNHQGADAY